MPAERNEIVHLLDGPWYGPAENAFNTFNRDLPEFSHVFADVSEEAAHGPWTEEWLSATADAQRRADQHVVPFGDSVFGRAFRVVSYATVPPFLSPPPERTLVWSMGGAEGASATAVPWLEPGLPAIPPLVDHSRMIGACGRVTRPTVGVLWSPHGPGAAGCAGCARILAGSLPPGHRLIVTDDPSLPVEGSDGGPEVAREAWRIGFDWMFGPLCSAVACDGGSEGYPFLLVCCMAMGRACVAICGPGAPRPPFVSHAVTCLVAESPEEAASMLSWLAEERNSGKARRLGAAAQAASASEDRDRGLAGLRRMLL